MAKHGFALRGFSWSQQGNASRRLSRSGSQNNEHISLLHARKENARPSSSHPLTWRQVAFICMLCFVNFCNFVCYSLIAPFFPKEAVSKGASISLSSWVFAVYELTAFLICPIFGTYISTLGSRFLFVAGLSMTGTACILFGFLSMVKSLTSFASLAFAIRIIEAIGASAYITSSYAIAAGQFPSRVGTVQGLMETFSGVGISIGPVIGGALYEAGGYYLPFVVMGSILLVIGLSSILTLPAGEAPSRHSGSMWSLLCKPGILLPSISTAIGALALGFYEPNLELHIDSLVSSPLQVGLVFLALGASYALTTPLWGIASDFTKNPKLLMVLGSILVAIGFMLLGPVPFLGLKLELWVVILASVISGFGVGGLMVPPLKDTLSEAIENGLEANENLRGLLSGLLMSMFSLGAFLGPLIGGSLVGVIGFAWSAFVVSGICVALAVVLIVQLLLRFRVFQSQGNPYQPIVSGLPLVD